MRTERANALMRSLLADAQRLAPVSLDHGLEAYVREGVVVDVDGAIISAAARRTAHGGRERFVDCVEYEAFVNKAHLDDWSSDALARAPISEKLAHALILANRIGAWAMERGLGVAVIISAEPATRDIVFRFHGAREGDAPWAGDVDKYAEPVVIITY